MEGTWVQERVNVSDVTTCFGPQCILGPLHYNSLAFTLTNRITIPFSYFYMYALSIDKIEKIELLIVIPSQQDNNAMDESGLEFLTL